jgi:hypothetical protein
MTSKGPQQNGFIVVAQQGVRLRAELHSARGAVKAANVRYGPRYNPQRDF